MNNDPKLLFRMKTFSFVFSLPRGVSVFAADKPNILLILADDLGYGDAGCYNDQSKVPVSPRLDFGISPNCASRLWPAMISPLRIASQ